MKCTCATYGNRRVPCCCHRVLVLSCCCNQNVTLQLIHGGMIFCVLLSWSQNGPHGPSRGCLVSANIIILFVCGWSRVCVCMCALWAQASNFMPSLKLCQVFLQQPVSLLFFYNSTCHPHHMLQHVSHSLIFNLHLHTHCLSVPLLFPSAWVSSLYFFLQTVICTSTTPPPLPPSLLLSSLHSYVWALSSGCTFHFGIVLSMHCCIQSS